MIFFKKSIPEKQFDYKLLPSYNSTINTKSSSFDIRKVKTANTATNWLFYWTYKVITEIIKKKGLIKNGDEITVVFYNHISLCRYLK